MLSSKKSDYIKDKTYDGYLLLLRPYICLLNMVFFLSAVYKTQVLINYHQSHHLKIWKPYPVHNSNILSQTNWKKF